MDHHAVEGFLPARQGVPDACRDWFARSAPRDQFLRHLIGPFRRLERQAMAPSALRVAGGTVRARQRGLSEVAWDEAPRLRTSQRLVDAERGDPEGVRSVAASSVPNKGRDCGGVARQYGGARGKVAHGQVGVLAAYAARQGSALVDKPRFRPEPWWTAAYAQRRTPCAGPDARGVQTMPP